MTVRIVGFNLSHDSSVCLVEDGVIRAALALERTSRVKHGTVPPHAYACSMAGLVSDILAGAGLRPADIDHWIATSTESRDAADEARLTSVLGLLVPPELSLRLPHPGHHLAHASAAFYSSGFDEAAALVIDAYGSLVAGGRERETAFDFHIGDTPRTVLATIRESDRIAGLPRDGATWLPATLSGVGELYRVITLALGFRETGAVYDDAGKTMGLASYGTRMTEENLFIEPGLAGELTFDKATESLVELGLAVRYDGELRLVPRDPRQPFERFHYDLAAQIQAEFEEACLHLIREVLTRTGSRTLVVSGGSFLNSTLNTRILRDTDVERLFIFPAATDDGNSAGAALYAHHNLIGRGATVLPAIRNVYFGPPRVSGCDLGSLVDRWGLTARRHAKAAELVAAAAAAIARGEIVGWFADRSEFGPRALGARSILCHPGLPGMKDRLNARVKFRETFRPFAGAVLAEEAPKWFDMPAATSAFMLHVCPVPPERQAMISEVVHVDGTCRVQTVEEDTPGDFRALIEAFERETGLPVVLNTSFNLRGMPMVERPEEALDCLYGARLDRLFLGDLEIEPPDLTALRPLREEFGAAPAAGSLAARILDLATGQKSMRQLAAVLGTDVDETVDAALDLRRLGQLRWADLPRATGPEMPLPQYSPDTRFVREPS